MALFALLNSAGAIAHGSEAAVTKPQNYPKRILKIVITSKMCLGVIK